jgi:outer membrane protein assembly factor BamD (BamD/ComL family)
MNVTSAPIETAAAQPAPSKRSDNTTRARDSLEDESALLTEARAELRSGDARASMATLDRLRAQFPKGVLAQEREVLGIEVLAALGDSQGASRKARAFSDAHPNSPHTAKLRRFIIDE